MAATHPDPETALDTLVAAGAVDEAPDGTLTTTETFERDLSLYHDVYGGVSTAEFHRTVAHLFDVDEDAVEDRIAELGVTRDDVVAYLALRSFLDAPVGRDLLSVMAGIVVELTPSSPVPDALAELDDGSYESFLDEHPNAVVTVWRRFCDPCDEMKAELDGILAAVPDGVAVAGVDGEAADDFCRRFEVDAAPAVLCFVDGELEARRSGRQSPEEVGNLLDGRY